METTSSLSITKYSVAAAWGCLALAVVSYPLLLPPLTWFGPFTAISAIALGRAARHTLPSERRRERNVAAVGMVLASIPVGLVILGIILLQVVLVLTMVTGAHCWGSCPP